ncbi:MAG: phage holin family protein [Prevotella sp.]|nr:phage holin family protein [Prevotella sp.]
MMLIAIMASLIVLFAMIIDLFSGLRKAKIRGDLRSSEALKRTLTKFITYEGGMGIALGVDMLIHFSKLPQLFGLDVIYGVPVVTCMVGVFLLVVEFLSVREKADQKTKKQMSDAANLLNDMLQNDNLREVFRVAIEHETRVKTEEDAV